MSNEAYTEVLEVVGGQFRQHGVVDRVLAKRLLVLLQPETVEPFRNVHARLPDTVTAARVNPTPNCRRARILRCGLSQPTVTCASGCDSPDDRPCWWASATPRCNPRLGSRRLRVMGGGRRQADG